MAKRRILKKDISYVLAICFRKHWFVCCTRVDSGKASHGENTDMQDELFVVPTVRRKRQPKTGERIP